MRQPWTLHSLLVVRARFRASSQLIPGLHYFGATLSRSFKSVGARVAEIYPTTSSAAVPHLGSLLLALVQYSTRYTYYYECVRRRVHVLARRIERRKQYQ